jgi:hypothetical protein
MNPIKLTVVINDVSLRQDVPGEHGLCLHLYSGVGPCFSMPGNRTWWWQI